MSVELNHTIVLANDKQATAEYFATLLGLRVDAPYGPFLPVETSNHVTLDFLETEEQIPAQHYAFLVSEAEFDAIFRPHHERRYHPLRRSGPQGTWPDQP